MKLSAEGYRVETAENGEEGVQKTKTLKPDLVLMDVNMPKMDGATAVLALRADPETKVYEGRVSSRALAIRWLDMQQINIKFSEEFGAQGYLKKTDDLDNLAEK